MIGILLAGGEGTRVRALTRGGNKHLLPVGGEPMIAHGLRKLASAGVERILLVVNTRHLEDFEAYLAGGVPGKDRISLLLQDRAGGIGEALALCAPHLPDPHQGVAMLLGDNLFEVSLGSLIKTWRGRSAGSARILLSEVDNPADFGIARLDPAGRLLGLIEKPPSPVGSQAVTGIYLLPARAALVARRAPPSARGEIEIFSVLNAFLAEGLLESGPLLGWWVDAGSPEGLARAERLLAERPPVF